MEAVNTQQDIPSRVPEHDLRLSGTLSMTLIVNLATFVAEPDDDSFRHVRGSEFYATALRSLHPLAPFGLDDADQTSRERRVVLDQENCAPVGG